MRKILITILVVASAAIAQDDISINPQPIGGGKYLGARTSDNQTTVPVLGIDQNGDTAINSMSGRSVEVSVAKTPVAYFGGPAFVPTMAATPVAGTNFFRPGPNVIPTAAANTAAFLGAATPVVGQEFIITNNSGASVRAKASGGATLNGAVAGGYIVIANLATVRCRTASLTNQTCEQPVIPTPAGP